MSNTVLQMQILEPWFIKLKRSYGISRVSPSDAKQANFSWMQESLDSALMKAHHTVNKVGSLKGWQYYKLWKTYEPYSFPFTADKTKLCGALYHRVEVRRGEPGSLGSLCGEFCRELTAGEVTRLPWFSSFFWGNCSTILGILSLIGFEGIPCLSWQRPWWASRIVKVSLTPITLRRDTTLSHCLRNRFI